MVGTSFCYPYWSDDETATSTLVDQSINVYSLLSLL